MFHQFKNYMIQYSELSNSDIDRMCLLARVKKISRNEYLLREGEVCRYKAFVMAGLLRTFVRSSEGSEYILKFSLETSWVIDKESYDRQTAATTSINALEPSTVLLWSRDEFEGLVSDIVPLKSFIIKLTDANIYNSSQRLSTTLSTTPEERYEEFVRNNTDLLQRLPLRMIAAYLGISTRTLDRIRQKQLPPY